MFLPVTLMVAPVAAVVKTLKASPGMTCSEVGAGVGFPKWAGGQAEAWVLLWGREAPGTLEQVGAGTAAQKKQPEASVVLEVVLSLSVPLVACFGFLESVFQQTP